MNLREYALNHDGVMVEEGGDWIEENRERIYMDDVIQADMDAGDFAIEFDPDASSIFGPHHYADYTVEVVNERSVVMREIVLTSPQGEKLYFEEQVWDLF